MLLRMAWRNLWRHRTRTIIMTSAVALTYAMGLLAMSIGDDSHQRMLHEAITAAGGDVLIHRRGFWDTRASDAVMPAGDSLTQVIAAMPGVGAVMPRVLTSALVSTSSGTRAALLQGVDPARETELSNPAEDIIAGTFLAEDPYDGIVLGSRLADRLDLEIGDRVVLTASQPDGEVTRALFHLTGIIEAGSRELDEVMAYTTVAAARRALRMGDALTQIGVVASDGDAAALAVRIREALGTEQHDLEALSWADALPEMVGFIQLDDAFGYIYLAVILLIVLFSITNTFLMAVMERVRELGLLSALGMSGRRISHVLIWETVLLTTLAMVVGFGIGLAGHFAVDHWGISIASYGIEEIEISGVDLANLVIRSSINPFKWMIATVAVAVATIGSALYPAFRASRLAPSEAMRFYE